MRDLIQSVHLGVGATSRRKVYIIDEVHMLSPAASNTLLKTLEEPPAHVVFVLATTDPHKVLPTIRSRTQHFEFTLLSNDDLHALTVDIADREGVAIDAEAVDAVVRQGAGSARDALSKLDMALAVGTGDGDHHHIDTSTVLAAFGGTGFERRVAVLQAIADDDAAGALIAVEEALRSGIDPRELAEELLTTLRDAFVRAASGGRLEYDGPADEAERLDALGAAAGLPRLTRGIETLGDAIADMRGAGAPDPRLLLEVAVVRLARREARAGIDAVLERLERLEARFEQLAAGGHGLAELGVRPRVQRVLKQNLGRIRHRTRGIERRVRHFVHPVHRRRKRRTAFGHQWRCAAKFTNWHLFLACLHRSIVPNA